MVKNMKIRLGYVSIPKTLNITCSHRITYTNYIKYPREIGLHKLDEIIAKNLENLKEILKYNLQNDITFYRLSSSIIPLATHPALHYDYLKNHQTALEEIGKFINENHMRIDTHPDQFCVLNSCREKVVQNSIEILKYNYKLLKSIKLSPQIIIHIGSSELGKENALIRFENNFNKLPKYLKESILLENDDKTYTLEDTLNLCEKLNIKMVFDYHHYKCNNKGEDLEKYLPRIIKTWKNQTPKMHFSSPKNKKEFRSHSAYLNPDEFIEFLNILKPLNKNIDIMLECKAKDDALFNLIRILKYKNYQIKGTEINI